MKVFGLVLLALGVFLGGEAGAVSAERLPAFVAWAQSRGGVTGIDQIRGVLRVRAGGRLMNADLDTKRTILKAFFDHRIVATPALTSAALIDAATGATVLSYSPRTGFSN